MNSNIKIWELERNLTERKNILRCAITGIASVLEDEHSVPTAQISKELADGLQQAFNDFSTAYNAYSEQVHTHNFNESDNEKISQHLAAAKA